MIEALKNQEIVQKVGGRFKLTALVQKRMAELLQGSRPLIEDTQGMTLLEIVIQEILQDKITIEGSPVDTEAQKEGEPAAQ
ncbi:MAG: DNA-directed RNA polymerase subunit omega [Planctomycetota bacterium]|jgi:DNA-directed RNA polymerase subunit omega